jgi:urea transport system substrate-binding protein
MKSKREIPVGVIYSTTGPYAAVGREMLQGAILAIEEVNANETLDFVLIPQICNPGGDTQQYFDICRGLVKGGNISHVIGCYTSSSRKEIIPIIEKFDALLWYPSHYEGFEACNNIIYLGASPNQHIVPLAEYMIRARKLRVYCCGSNYIWPWENNRVMRTLISSFGGAVLAERYLPIGSTDVEPLIDEIRALRPDFIFNTLIGESSYAFFRAYAKAGRTDCLFSPSQIPVTSCSLSEPELLVMGGTAGHIVSSVYFQTIDSRENHEFVGRYKARFGQDKVTSADAESSYNSVLLLAQALNIAETTDVSAVREALRFCKLQAPQGAIHVDMTNNHCYLTPRLGRSLPGGQFEIISAASSPTKPDPYLTSLSSSCLATYEALSMTTDLPITRSPAPLRLVRK